MHSTFFKQTGMWYFPFCSSDALLLNCTTTVFLQIRSIFVIMLLRTKPANLSLNWLKMDVFYDKERFSPVLWARNCFHHVSNAHNQKPVRGELTIKIPQWSQKYLGINMMNSIFVCFKHFSSIWREISHTKAKSMSVIALSCICSVAKWRHF